MQDTSKFYVALTKLLQLLGVLLELRPCTLLGGLPFPGPPTFVLSQQSEPTEIRPGMLHVAAVADEPARRHRAVDRDRRPTR